MKTERNERPFNPNWRIWELIDVYDEDGNVEKMPILMKPHQVGEGWYDFDKDIEHEEVWIEWAPAEDNTPEVLEAYAETVAEYYAHQDMLRDMDYAMGRR